MTQLAFMHSGFKIMIKLTEGWNGLVLVSWDRHRVSVHDEKDVSVESEMVFDGRT
jgi:hypothetical protein